jgi:hypothetical protein
LNSGEEGFSKRENPPPDSNATIHKIFVAPFLQGSSFQLRNLQQLINEKD